jgi:hypothetical protein
VDLEDRLGGETGTFPAAGCGQGLVEPVEVIDPQLSQWHRPDRRWRNEAVGVRVFGDAGAASAGRTA